MIFAICEGSKFRPFLGVKFGHFLGVRFWVKNRPRGDPGDPLIFTPIFMIAQLWHATFCVSVPPPRAKTFPKSAKTRFSVPDQGYRFLDPQKLENFGFLRNWDPVLCQKLDIFDPPEKPHFWVQKSLVFSLIRVSKKIAKPLFFFQHSCSRLTVTLLTSKRFVRLYQVEYHNTLS